MTTELETPERIKAADISIDELYRHVVAIARWLLDLQNQVGALQQRLGGSESPQPIVNDNTAVANTLAEMRQELAEGLQRSEALQKSLREQIGSILRRPEPPPRKVVKRFTPQFDGSVICEEVDSSGEPSKRLTQEYDGTWIEVPDKKEPAHA
jgi:hypothetical protein